MQSRERYEHEIGRYPVATRIASHLAWIRASVRRRPPNEDLIAVGAAFSLIKILRRQAKRERKVVCRRSRKRSSARYKFIITRASKHAAGFLARSAPFSLRALPPFPFSSVPCLPVYLSTREISTRPTVSPAFRDAHRLSIKKLYNTIPLLVCFPV